VGRATLFLVAATLLLSLTSSAHAAGNAVAVWSSFDGSARRIEASYRPAGGNFAQTPEILAYMDGSGTIIDLDVVMDASGRAIATRELDPIFDPAQDDGPIRTEGDQRPRVAIDTQGNAVLTWIHGFPDNTGSVQAASLPAGGAIGPVEPVSDAADVQDEFYDLTLDSAGDAHAPMRSGATAHRTFRRTAKRATSFRTLKRCRVRGKRITCR